VWRRSQDLEAEGASFLRNNQGTIARHGVNFAQNNPQQAAAAARSASSFV
jgi:hypothetical protein